MTRCPPVYVCRGKDCRRSGDHAGLVRSLRSVADVKLVKCQKVCDGTVVGACLDDRLEWFEDIAKPKSVDALVAAVADDTPGDALPDRLAKRRLSTRTGRRPR